MSFHNIAEVLHNHHARDVEQQLVERTGHYSTPAPRYPTCAISTNADPTYADPTYATFFGRLGALHVL